MAPDTSSDQHADCERYVKCTGCDTWSEDIGDGRCEYCAARIDPPHIDGSSRPPVPDLMQALMDSLAAAKAARNDGEDDGLCTDETPCGNCSRPDPPAHIDGSQHGD